MNGKELTEKYRKADEELEAAVRHWDRSQAHYWLGRKQEIRKQLEDNNILNER